mmetsp:Transcript_114510/g.202071  ORF Transcript_114510/g.202071 Transcript_114510/m.202071 type:complete len:384 (-) Transcript_114510:44-1195(-)
MAALQTGAASDSEDEQEPYFSRMTPMEFDMQLQGAELIFRSLLQGQRIALSQHEDIDDWFSEVLGEKWCADNSKQRKEILNTMMQDGENSPAWMESLAHMSDIAWEVFEQGATGERVRNLEIMDRTEIIEQFKVLLIKVRISHYARCGAGDRLYGFRACIAILRVFIRDAEMLDYCAKVLRACVTENEYNRDGIASLTVPYPPPAERSEIDKDRGWSFFRAALDAFMVQAGAQPYECQEPEEQSKLESEGKVVIYREARKEIALRIAETIVAVREAPAFKAQLALLQEETPESAIKDRRELKAMIPLAFEKVEAMLSDESSLELMELRNILADAGGMPAAAADKQSESSDGSDDSQGSGMIQRPAGFDLLRPGGSRSFTQAYE